MGFCWDGLFHACILLASVRFTSGRPQTSGGNRENVFTAPLGGVVDTTEPVTIKWLPTTPGPVTIKLIRGDRELGPITDPRNPIPNNGSIVWNVPRELPRTLKYRLQIEDTRTGDTTSSNRDISFSPPGEQESADDASEISSPTPSPTPIPSHVFVTTTTIVSQLTTSTSTSVNTPTSTFPANNSTVSTNTSIPTSIPTANLNPSALPSFPDIPEPPKAGVIAGATVGACAAAGLLLTGAFIIWRRKQRNQGGMLYEGRIKQEQQEAINTYRHTRGMVNAF